jgi:hypothetical protein
MKGPIFMRKKPNLEILDNDLDLLKYSETLPRCHVCRHYQSSEYHFCTFYNKVIFIEILGLCTEEDSFEEVVHCSNTGKKS